MTTTRYYQTIREIRDANTEAGHHFFDDDTMRYFRSRIVGAVVAGRYFITAERLVFQGMAEPSRYTIRRANDDGSVETVGEFQEHASARAAYRALAAHLAANGVVCYCTGRPAPHVWDRERADFCGPVPVAEHDKEEV